MTPVASETRCWRCGAVVGCGSSCAACGAEVAAGHEVGWLRYALQNRQACRRCCVCRRVLDERDGEKCPVCSSRYATPPVGS